MNTGKKGYCVFGAGAVGSLFAARLAEGGIPVTLVARGTRLASLRAEGLRLRDSRGMRRIEGIAFAAADEMGEQDVLFIALKAHAIAAALEQLLPLIGPSTKVVPLVNGIPWWYFQPSPGITLESVDPAGLVARAIPAHQVVGAVVLVTVSVDADGIPNVTGPQRLALGWIDGRADRGLEALASTLTDCGIETRCTEAIRKNLWSKLALNLSSNPLSVVADATLQDQYGHPALVPVVTASLEETIALARAYDVEPTLSLEEMLAIGRAAGGFHTSMAQDYHRGLPLELPAIGHAALELAEMAGVSMPVTRMIVGIAGYRGDQQQSVGANICLPDTSEVFATRPARSEVQPCA